MGNEVQDPMAGDQPTDDQPCTLRFQEEGSEDSCSRSPEQGHDQAVASVHVTRASKEGVDEEGAAAGGEEGAAPEESAE